MPNRSPVTLLFGNRRFALFTLVMLPNAIAIAALAIARTQAAGSAGPAVIGSMAMAASIAGAATAMPVGAMVDAVGPRQLFLASSMASAVISVTTAFCAMNGILTTQLLIALAALDGAMVAVTSTSLVPMQMSIVDTPDRGSAQIVSVLRWSIGALIGTTLAGRVNNLALVAVTAGSIMSVTALITWAIARPRQVGAQPPRRLRASFGFTGLIREFQARPMLRNTVLVLLALELIIPSQLVNIVAADNDAAHLSYQGVLAGLVGAMVSRMILMATGINLPTRPTLVIAFTTYVVVGFVAALRLHVDTLINSFTFMLVLVFIATMSTSFVTDYTGALVQQLCPDEIRGRITGAVRSAVAVDGAIGVAFATTVQVRWHEGQLVTMLSILGVALLVATRGFAPLAKAAVQAGQV